MKQLKLIPTICPGLSKKTYRTVEINIEHYDYLTRICDVCYARANSLATIYKFPLGLYPDDGAEVYPYIVIRNVGDGVNPSVGKTEVYRTLAEVLEEYREI